VDYSARSRYRPPPPLSQRVQKRVGPLLISLGIGPKQVVVLEVPGRRSGLIRRSALVMATHNGNNYLVARPVNRSGSATAEQPTARW
jgi:hypothetical protein